MKKLQNILYQLIRFVVKRCYPKIQTQGLENLPQTPSLVVGNHSQMNGPIAAELYFSGERYIWCAGQMMAMKEVPAYAFQDFWAGKPRWSHWFYRGLSYVIAPVSVCIFNNAHTIPVYRDKRIITTFRQTIQRLNQGANVIIFPEHAQPHDHILCDFQEGFVDVAKLYYKQTGRCIDFVPMYLAPRLKTMYLGKPIAFCPDNPIQEERRRICDYLMNEISTMAQELPRHKVVPYLNVSRKKYGYNRPQEARINEKTCC